MPTTARQLFDESVPVAIVLFAWFLLAAIVGRRGDLQFAVRLSGGVMALLLVVLRGRALAGTVRPAYVDRTPAGVLRENGRALVPAGAWFLGAFLLDFVFLHQVAPRVGLTRGHVFVGTAELLVQAFAYTGLLTVVLVAVATGVAAYRSGRQV